ncbi:MAG TPA: Smr/MutS family protein [Gemmatimonadales bacterium]|jgi:DNA mismatch repair protein MutS2|nr:Smr/MutS family protein [Gemmatimonadales bacterium]
MAQSLSVSDSGVPAHVQGGTPSPLPEAQSADALETIEFAEVLELVAGHAVGPLGAARVRGRRPGDDIGWIAGELARVGEVAALFRRGDALLVQPIPDVHRALGRLRIDGSVLEGAELAALQRVLVAARLIQADLRRVAESAPLASGLARPLPDKRLERRLEQSLDPEGTLLDTASPALAAARREVHAARQRLIRKLESLLRGLDANTAPGDASVTVRGGRYVIPVRRDSRSRPGGIVHDESGSAGTLFIEPAEAIELGNALREAEVEEEREALRVLRELTDLLRPELSGLRELVEMCVAVDDLVARARYAISVEGEVPEMAPAPADLVIVNGRHPLLLAGTEPVVPFDLELSAAERTLLISGPNTGGKTVLLKAVGLAAALSQCGIVPPVGARSRLPVFRRFYADIGDRQSIAASLSTFSAHVRMLRRILDGADAATLVLLDEIGSGTDPAEGAALAAATLVSLTERGTLTLATTHLGSLKEVASHTPGVVNASLQFDAATLTPSYRFLKGVPGRSYGLAIARRLGVAPTILADAEARVPDAERSLDALLAAVEERQHELAAAQAELAERTVELDALQARLAGQQESQAAREAELRRREKEAERTGRQQARAYLLEARQRVEQALGAAKSAVDDAAAREARRLVEEGIRHQGEELERADGTGTAERADPGSGVAVGDRVRLLNGGAGQVLEIRPDGKLVVALGAMKIVVDAGQATRTANPRQPTPAASAPPAPSSPSALEIDLRGFTGDEAEAATLAAVDAAVLAEQPYLRIIHGMGTGVVRERVRRVVAGDRRIARFGFAPRNQGGTGVTVVEFSA